ncbi:hypothetical protein PV326_014392, partial [Microctonus aethiopoides]
YTEYADTFEEFRKKYPNFTLSISSEARSDSTFGEMTGDKFDDMSFTTSFFVADDNGYYRDILIAEASKTFSYSVNAIIKIGFLRKVITVSGVSIITSAPQSDNAVEEINRQPIVRRINFDRNINLEASWSGTSRKNDPIPHLFVLDYTEYADT